MTPKRTFGSLALAALVAAGVGCASANESTSAANKPAVTGPGGVPMLSEAQIAKLPPDQQERIRKGQEAMQSAASANANRSFGQVNGGK